MLVVVACAPPVARPDGNGPLAEAPGGAVRFGAPVATTTTTTLPPLAQPRTIKVANANAWQQTNCAMFPTDNYWHADVRHLPTKDPISTNGSGLSDYPVPDGWDPFRLVSGLGSGNSKTITWTSADDPWEWVRSEGSWTKSSEYTDVEIIQVGPVTQAWRGMLRQRVPDEVLLELSSTDDHALFVDTDSCTLYEHIRWDRSGGNLAQNSTVNDLGTNERRLSVRPGWLTPTHNGPGRVIDSPYTWHHPWTIGLDGYDTHLPRSGSTASGGSGLPTSAGMVRIDEVFASPAGNSEEVAADARIDHAIAATIPMANISSMPSTIDGATVAPFVWPATKTDGCANKECPDKSMGSDFHLPMGSRIRLSQEACARDWQEPQASVIVRAMCEHGVVITDSSMHFKISTERSGTGSGDSKWRKEAKDELATLTLRDFEIVDASSLATFDTSLLWETARSWAIDRYGANAPLPSGWFQGTFWHAFTNCDRDPWTASDLQRPPCHDAALDAVDRTVNGPDWFRAR